MICIPHCEIASGGKLVLCSEQVILNTAFGPSDVLITSVCCNIPPDMFSLHTSLQETVGLLLALFHGWKIWGLENRRSKFACGPGQIPSTEQDVLPTQTSLPDT